MAIKLRGESLKEGSLRLSSLPQGMCDYLLSIFELSTPVYSVTTDKQSIGINRDKLFIKANNYDLLEIYKNETISLSHGPEVTITYDNNGLISSTDSNNFYNIQVSPFIQKKVETPTVSNALSDWNASSGETGYIKNRTHYCNEKLQYRGEIEASINTVVTYQLSPYEYIDNIVGRAPDKIKFTGGGISFTLDFIKEPIPSYNYEEDRQETVIKRFTIDSNNDIEVSYYQNGDPDYIGGIIIELNLIATDSAYQEYITFATEDYYVDLKQIDDIYIPDTIARKSDLENSTVSNDRYIIDLCDTDMSDDSTIPYNTQELSDAINSNKSIYIYKDGYKKGLIPCNAFYDGEYFLSYVDEQSEDLVQLYFGSETSEEIQVYRRKIAFPSDILNNTIEFYNSTVLNLKYVSSENKVYYKGYNTSEWTELAVWILDITIGKGVDTGTTLSSVNMCVINDTENPYIINDFKIYADETSGPALTWNYNGKKYTWYSPENISIEEISDNIYILPFTRDDVEMAFNASPNVPMPFDSIEELKQAVAKNKLIYIKHGGMGYDDEPLYGSAPCSVVCDMFTNTVTITFLYENIIYTLLCSGYAVRIRTRIDLDRLTNTISDVTIEE